MELPTYIQIEPVGQCNLRCTMCPIQFRQDGPPYGPPAFLPFETFTRLVDEFTGLKQLHLQGLGEPMMHPRFFDMVSYGVGKGIQVTTNSNLTLINPKRAEACVTSGLDTLHISVDGASPEMYERIRVRGKFERVMRNIGQVLQARERLRSELPHLHMVTVIMKQNLHELPALVRLAHEWQMEEMFVQHLSHDFNEATLPALYQPMRDYVNEQTLLTQDLGRIERYFGEARQIAQELGIKLRLPRTRTRVYPAGTPGRERCSWPWTGAYISYQGYAMPCCMIATPDRGHFGNLVEQGVEATWNGPAYQTFRDQLASENPPDVCRSCSLYSGTF
jgi:radical SAM protein with 4Fe4S-binding SPASM domain